MKLHQEPLPSRRGKLTMKSIAQALEQTVDMAAKLENREIGLAILPCSTSGDILAIDAPGDLLATIADSSVKD
jgi:hypothetical protein